MTLGAYLRHRLREIGIEHFFVVPGDFNLALLDELMAGDELKLIGCCNELNAGFAANGYARVKASPSARLFTQSIATFH